MKKLLCVMVLLVMAAVMYAQTIVWGSQHDLTWDWTGELADGTPIPATDTTAFNLYLKRQGDTTVIDMGEIPTAVPEWTLIISDEGFWVPGVSAVRYANDQGGARVESTILWSTDTINPFVIGYVRPPADVEDLRLQ